MCLLDAREKVCPFCGFNEDVYFIEKNKNALMPGVILKDRYLIGKVLGAGGFGITYLGFDNVLKIKVAIKEYFPVDLARRSESYRDGTKILVTDRSNEESYHRGLEKFLSEARILARLSHEPGVVSVQNFFYDNNSGYIIMNYLPGPNLKDMVEKLPRPMEAEEIVNLLLPLIHALGEVHKMGVIHCDISPDNIVLDEKGGLVLIDFGAAKTMDLNKKSMTIVLKKGYAPPEQYSSTIVKGPWTDVYSLCATIYFMVTHAVPPDAIARWSEDSLYGLYDLGMAVSREFSEVIKKGMSLQVSERYQTMEELEKALLSSIHRESGPAEGVTERAATFILDDTDPLFQTSVLFPDYPEQPGIQSPFSEDRDAGPGAGPGSGWRERPSVPDSADSPQKTVSSKRTKIMAMVCVLALGAVLVLTLSYYQHMKKSPSSVQKRPEAEATADSEAAASGDTNDQGSKDAASDQGKGDASSENAGPENSTVSDPAAATEMTEEIKKLYPDDAVEFQGHHYLLVNEPMGWKRAKKKCEDMKGHLATITSPEEQDFICRLIEEKGEKYHYWLGATDRNHEGNWEWITGEAWAYQNWEEGQPNNSDYYDKEHGQDYLELQATYGDNGDQEYMTWTDISEDGVSPDFMEGPEYNSTPYSGFICEWDE